MERKALIAKLAKCQYNPIQDVKALEAISDEGLTALETHCAEQAEKFKTLQDELDDVKLELTTAQEANTENEKKIRTAEAEVRRAKKPLTDDEWIATAPPAMKTLIERQRKQDDEKREVLVAELKTAQEEYTEDELETMPLGDVERLARVIGLGKEQPADFSAARAVPRAAADKDDVFLNPPDPYAEAIKRRNDADTKRSGHIN